MTDDRKQQRIDEVHALLADFANQHLVNAPDLAGYIHKLSDAMTPNATLGQTCHGGLMAPPLVRFPQMG
ncbi:MAG: hypothetical protein V1929_09500 [bacterium]